MVANASMSRIWSIFARDRLFRTKHFSIRSAVRNRHPLSEKRIVGINRQPRIEPAHMVRSACHDNNERTSGRPICIFDPPNLGNVRE